MVTKNPTSLEVLNDTIAQAAQLGVSDDYLDLIEQDRDDTDDDAVLDSLTESVELAIEHHVHGVD